MTWREAPAGTPIATDCASFQLTASFGVAPFPAQAGSVAELLLCADERQYQAKAMGRDRVVGDINAELAGVDLPCTSAGPEVIP